MDIILKPEGLISNKEQFNTTSFSNSVCVLNAYELCEILKKNGNIIFKKNIREYLGPNKDNINKEVIFTIKNHPNDFFAYNNGITIEATEITHNPNGILLLKNFSVINGGQTINNLYHVYQENINLINKSKLSTEEKNKSLIVNIDYFKNIKVLAKIIIVSTPNSIKSHLLSKYVNSQNIIKSSDYASTQTIQQKIKQTLAETYGIYYQEKSSNKKQTKENAKGFNCVISLETFYRNYYALFNDPSSSKTSAKKIFHIEYNKAPETPIDSELNSNYDQTLKKMLLAYFLVNYVKDEMAIFLKFKNFCNSINWNSPDKSLLLELYDLAVTTKNQKLISTVNQPEGFTKSEILNQDIYLIGKGKYIYSYFILKFLEKHNKLSHILDTLNNFEKINLLNSEFRELLYKISSKIDPILKELNKSENQITMNIPQTTIDKIVSVL